MFGVRNKIASIIKATKLVLAVILCVVLLLGGIAYAVFSKRLTLSEPELLKTEGEVVSQEHSEQEKLDQPVGTFDIRKDKVVKGTGVINLHGTVTNFEVNIPITGGSVNGTASGYCNGQIEGVFDSKTGFIHGSLSGSCVHEGVKLPAVGTFKGNISINDKSGKGTFDGSATVYSRSGEWNLVISDITVN